MGKNIITLFLLIVFCIPLSCADDKEIIIDELLLQSDDIINPTSEYFAVLGDCQYHFCLSGLDGVYKTYIDWIECQSNAYGNFKALLHTGDIAETNDVSQYQLFVSLTEGLANKVPYFSAIGDHDYTWEGNNYVINDRYSTYFNDYVQFPLSKSKVVAMFEEGRMENCVVELSVQGSPLYLLFLEFGPRKEVVEWARDYVSSHTSSIFVVVNHEYLENGGERRTKNLMCVGRLRNTSYTTPEELWKDLISCNDNIVCILCGHVDSLYAVTPDDNNANHIVPQIEFNIQTEAYRNDNWLMLWEFPADSDSASVSIYNVKNHSFLDNKSVLTKFKYR